MATSVSAPASLRDYFAHFGEVEARALTRVQVATARAMARNWTSIPHVTHHDEVEITEVDRRIRDLRSSSGERHTLLGWLARACVDALALYPHFNASLDADGTTLLLKRYVNLGFAVDTAQGLVVPVVRGCEARTAPAIAEEVEALSATARSKGLPFAAMEGSSFTISSLGAIGGTAFTPIINAPDVAILGVTRARLRPVFEGGAVRPALMLPLSLSYDHRVINGADAARFVIQVGESLKALAQAG